jgi:polysaccharide export outer membrane protein
MAWRQSVCAAMLAVSLGGCGHRIEFVDLIPVLGPAPAGAPIAAPADAVAMPVSARAHAGPRLVDPVDGPYLLDTGDRLRIFVYGQPNLSRLYTVDQSGNIAFPLVGTVRARGATTTALEKAIGGRLSTNYVKDPQVTVDVQQHRPFFILGEVRNAGQYPYVSGLTVEAAVAVAGGYQERASEERFRITRRTSGVVEVMEVPPDFPIRPGDTVYVHERFF